MPTQLYKNSVRIMIVGEFPVGVGLVEGGDGQKGCVWMSFGGNLKGCVSIISGRGYLPHKNQCPGRIFIRKLWSNY